MLYFVNLGFFSVYCKSRLSQIALILSYCNWSHARLSSSINGALKASKD